MLTAFALFFWKSVDGGASWRRVPFEVGALVADRRKSATVYATDVGVMRSTDGGETWALLASNVGVQFLIPDPKSDDTLYAGGPAGLFEIASPSATVITFDMTVVKVGASFVATISGSNLSDLYFDVQVRAPGSALDLVVLNWQRGTPVRAHQDPENHTGDFVPVAATITVSR